MRLVGACVVAAAALVVSVPISAAPAPVVGGPAPTSGVVGVPSLPLSRSSFSRPAFPEDSNPLGPGSVKPLPAGYSLVDVVVANTNASLASNDGIGDSEPSLAV